MTAKIIIVTGPIGSGKSFISSLLSLRGIPVYDCDSAAKSIYASHPELAREARPEIFSDPQRLQSLEDRLFPLLLANFTAWSQSMVRNGEAGGFVAIESATILQKSFFDNFGDYVLLVDAPVSLRRRRVLERGGISESSLEERMALQRDEKHNSRVSFVLDNSSDKEAALRQLDEFLNIIDYVKREN